jgi:uncharacterized membrane protein
MLTLLLRFTHVFFGALWVGMMTFQVFLLFPSLVEAGPESGKIMAALARRRIPLVMAVIALLALISGTWLFMRLMGDDAAGLMRTAMGKAYGWGGTAAILAFVLGFGVMRPAMMRSMRLAESLATATPDERARAQAEIQRLRARGATIGRVVTVLLMIALALMAVARYL